MGLFSSSSKSSSLTEASENTDSYGDYSNVDGFQNKPSIDLTDVSAKGKSRQDFNFNIQTLDGGAISESFEFAGETGNRAFDFAEFNNAALVSLYDDSLRALQDSSQRETETALFALNKASTLSGAELNKEELIKWGGILAAAFIVVYALKGK